MPLFLKEIHFSQLNMYLKKMRKIYIKKTLRVLLPTNEEKQIKTIKKNHISKHKQNAELGIINLLYLINKDSDMTKMRDNV